MQEGENVPIYFIQHCFICRLSDSTVSEDAGIELLRPWHWQPDALTARLDLIYIRKAKRTLNFIYEVLQWYFGGSIGG
jgi:hypothetical protein